MATKKRIANSFKKHIFISLLVVILSIVGLLWYIINLQNRLIETSALESAKLYSQALDEFRTLYTDNVVEKVNLHPDFEVTHNHKTKKNAIPLPATFSMELGKAIGKNLSGAETWLYSEYPFPWRRNTGGGLRDDFAVRAWEFLNKNPDKPYYEFVPNYKGQQALRYATADVMRSSCIDCHNTHPQTPKDNWKTGDVRGILEIVHPMKSILMKKEEDLFGLFLLASSIGVFGILSLLFLIQGYKGMNQFLAREIEIQTKDLHKTKEGFKSLSERLGMATKAAKLGVFDLNIETNFLFWDKSMFELYEISEKTFTDHYLAWTNCLYPKDKEKTIQEFNEAIENGEVYNTTFRILLSSGKIRYIKADADIYRNDKGKAVRLVGINYDITNQTRAEIALQQMNDELEILIQNRTAELNKIKEAAVSAMQDANRAKKNTEENLLGLKKSQVELHEALLKSNDATKAKSNFLANMSHEIRTPMNAILGFVDLTLNDTSLSHGQRENLSKAYRAAKGLLQLINDILDVSKFESGKLELEKRIFNLPKLLCNIVQILEIIAREKGLVLNLQMDPKISNVIGDPSKFRQILINLAGNAIKFTEKGSVTIQVEALEKDNLVHFTVVDTGIGIPADKQEAIFQPFTQVDESISRRFGGTGLGTTITKQLIELMEGKIWLESEVNKGSAFHFTITLPATESKPVLTGVFDSYEINVQPRRSFQVLLAEDIEDNIILAKIRLEQFEHVVSIARNGNEAIEKFEKGKFDIILMDVHMPITDGIEATKNIRKLEKNCGGHIPIIALTASVMEGETSKYKAAGMDEVAAKPVSFDLLLNQMEKIVPFGKGVVIKKMPRHITKKLVKQTSFSLEGVDVKKGLETWQDKQTYIDALKNFVKKYKKLIDDPHLFKKMNEKEIQSISHALRGLSGNLAMTQIYIIAGEIESAAKVKNWDVLKEKLPSLGFALSKTITSIENWEEGKIEEKKPKKVWDQAFVAQLLNEILKALDNYNPYDVEPFLNELKEYLSSQQVKPIEKCIGEFNFDGAKNKTKNLAKNLKIDLEK